MRRVFFVASLLFAVTGCSQSHGTQGKDQPARVAGDAPTVAVRKAALAAAPAAEPTCKEGTPPDEPQEGSRETVGDQGIVLGDARGSHTVVVFTDVQCPYCAKLHARMLTFLEAHPSDYRIVIRHRPLPFHEHATELARAAIAADRAGKGPAFVQAAFAAAKKEPADALDVAAREVGLDPAALRKDSESAFVTQTLTSDQAEGDRLAVRGTPTFFVDGRRVVGAREDLDEQIIGPAR